MTPEIAELLRKPFGADRIGKLPRVTCGACRDSRSRVCDNHKKSRCDECASWITGAHIHLDFVGHADTTDRLLEADPEWAWEPFALDPRGLPALDDNGGMWIRLTVAGVTRIGYGDADGKRGGNAVKETVGDAIRNAAMRFGVALDLWRKETHVDESTAPRPAAPVPLNRQNIMARATAAIQDASLKEDCDRIGQRITEHEQAERITANDAVELRRQLVARLDALFPADEQKRIAEAAPVDQRQHKRMHALWREVGLGGNEHRETRLTRTSLIVGRDIDSSADLTAAEADKVIAALEAERKRAEPPQAEQTPEEQK